MHCGVFSSHIWDHVISHMDAIVRLPTKSVSSGNCCMGRTAALKLSDKPSDLSFEHPN